jgi:hypothetical protein
MTRYGVHRLLKHNALKEPSAAVLTVVAALFFSIFFSCKSASPVIPSVDPFALINPDASFYVYMPVKANQKFAQKMLCAEFEGMSEKDAAQIAGRTDTLIFASDFENSPSMFQIAASGKYPLAAVQLSLTESNGWRKKIYSETTVPYAYYLQKGGSLQIAIPSSVCAVLSDDVAQMISLYEKALASELLQEEKLTKPVNDTAVTSTSPDGWNEGVYDFLSCGKPGEIKFIAYHPASFVTLLLKKDINLGIETIAGTMVQNAKEGIFNLELNIEVTDTRAIKAALSMLKIALFPVPAEIVQIDQNHIKITSLTITWDGLTRLLVKK